MDPLGPARARSRLAGRLRGDGVTVGRDQFITGKEVECHRLGSRRHDGDQWCAVDIAKLNRQLVELSLSKGGLPGRVESHGRDDVGVRIRGLYQRLHRRQQEFVRVERVGVVDAQAGSIPD